MDRNLVYSKTPSGEEATLQRTRVVQRNLRMVLLQVDGQLNVAGLVEKIGNESLVFNALRELEKGGFIALSLEAPSVWEQSKQRIKAIKKAATGEASQFSVFGASKELPAGDSVADSSNFSTFGKPVLPVLEPTATSKAETPAPAVKPVPSGPGVGERLALWLSSLKPEPSRDLAPYKPKSWPKRIAMTLVVLFMVLVLGILLYPYSSYRPAIEAAIAETVGLPVKIGTVEARFLPRPVLALTDVRMGQSEEVRVSEILIPRLLALKSSGRKEVGTVELSGVTMNADFAASLLKLQDGVRNNPQFALDGIAIKGLSLSVGDLSLPGFNGKMSFLPGAATGHLLLQSPDGTLKIGFSPSSNGAVVNIEGLGWKPAEGSPYQFSSLTAKGLLQPGKVVFQSVELSVLDGSAQGSLLVDWSKGFSLAGDAALSRMSVRKVSKALGASLEMDGVLSGSLRLRSSANGWQGVWEGIDANLAFQVDQGVMNGVDLGEATRRGSGTPVRGGSTKFERMKGNLLISATQVTGSNVDVDSGLLKATGQFMARRDKSVDATMQVNIQSSAAQIRAPIHITGMLPTLQTMVVR